MVPICSRCEAEAEVLKMSLITSVRRSEHVNLLEIYCLFFCFSVAGDNVSACVCACVGLFVSTIPHGQMKGLYIAQNVITGCIQDGCQC